MDSVKTYISFSISFITSSVSVWCQFYIHFAKHSSFSCEPPFCNIQNVCTLSAGCIFVFHITITMNDSHSHISNNRLVFVMETQSVLYEVGALILC
jgi:hypothetical protein